MSAPDEQADGNDRHIGRKVAEARESAGLSQDDVARHIGLTRSSVANIESGRQRVHAVRLAMLAQVLGVEVSWLLSTVELPPQAPMPHNVAVQPLWQVTCETCAPGQPFAVATSSKDAAEERRAHIAEMLEAAAS
jgi:transcriptional regulator with XRE-family HTH domain